MAKTKISEYSATPADNTDISNIDIAEGCSPANVNNAIRGLMAQLKDQQDGSSGDPFTVAGTLVSSGTVDITGAFRLDGTAGASGQVLLSAGGSTTPTWSTLGTMASQNSTTVAITGGTITGITDLTVADGGTGASSITANSVILGNGTSALSGNLVAPSTSGNVLTSNGTTWTSAALPTGGVTSLNGQTGAITDTDQYAIGSYVIGRPQDVANYTNNTTVAGSSLYATSINNGSITRGSSTWSTGANQSLINTGTWRCLGSAYGNGSTAGYPGLWVRIS
jgi:hypothetical protein